MTTGDEHNDDIDYNDMVIAISNLATAMEVRNEIDCKRLKMDERREVREWRFKTIMLVAILILAGAEVSQIIGLL